MPKASPFDPELVRELAKLIAETDLTEIEVEKGDLRIRVARTITASVTVPVAAPALAPTHSAAQPAAVPAPVASSDSAPAGRPSASHPGAITSPMVGTAYLRPAPEAPSRSSRSARRCGRRQRADRRGDEDLQRHRRAPRPATVTAILIEDGQPVEYGEPLMIIE